MTIKLQKRPYELSGKLLNEYKMEIYPYNDMMDFEVTEASENSPYQVGETFSISKNELKYHIIKL